MFWFNPLAGSWVFTGNQEKFVIGDLGGRPVSIPRDFARFVEYDGDPGFMKKREVPVPKRTYQSRLRSFGYEVRYPDMAGRSRETAQEKEYETIYNTMWLRVGLSSGEDYHPREEKDDHLDGYLKMALQPRGENTLYVIFEHQKLHETMYGLEAHVPVRARYSGRKFVPIDEMRKKVKNDYFDRNYYVLRREDGHIKTFINCGNGPYESANCTQKFRLRSPMRAYVDISYRRGLLPYWQEIQEKVTAQLLGFQVDSGI
ncbi:hypothetical protein FACS1894116_14380 [Betaproteobacteria bacterium]|nr:hypothetical protein FACS1894116_14380 [Betaproteobacteria bacterium]GHT98495.1 hypothetical protein FACS1894154_03880 [Betaproteobacteria bacterium]GHU26328.1 hypothetical protein FACS189488_14450 [Betaproteobacteria bacterium]